MSRFNPREVHVEFVVSKVTWAGFLLNILVLSKFLTNLLAPPEVFYRPNHPPLVLIWGFTSDPALGLLGNKKA
jgi:hypothetical protein